MTMTEPLTIVLTPNESQLYRAPFAAVLAAWLKNWPASQPDQSLKASRNAIVTDPAPSLSQQLSACLAHWSLNANTIDCLAISSTGMTYKLTTNSQFHPIATYLKQIHHCLNKVVLTDPSPLDRIIHDNLLTYLTEEISVSRPLTTQTHADFEVFVLILEHLQTQAPTELLTQLVAANLAADIPLVEPNIAWRYLRYF